MLSASLVPSARCFSSHYRLRCSALEPITPSSGWSWRCRGPLSPTVFAQCLPASHWLGSDRGFLSLHISLSPPALHCAASYPRSFFLPLPLTALTPSLYFPLPISVSRLCYSPLSSESLIVLPSQLLFFASFFAHSFSSISHSSARAAELQSRR